MSEVEKLEQAIATLEAQRAVLGDAVVDTALAPLREKLAALKQPEEAPEQQRKLVTVLFADIVRSTQMSQGLEPEEVLEIMDGALERMAFPIDEHGGHVHRFMGDGFLAVFGLPATRENDARQAVRAGLAILDVAKAYAEELERHLEICDFDVRVGINTGLVAAGGFSEAADTVMGLTVNLAARLETAAPPGGVLISEYTYRHVRGAFDVEAQQPIIAKGFAEPVPVYLVSRAKPLAFRASTRGVQGVETAMVGRDAELQQLQSALEAAIGEVETHLLTVVGDAGVGKSRLLYEFDRWATLHPAGAVAFKGRASQQTMGTPFGLLRDLFARGFGILYSDPAEVARQKLETGLAEFFEDEPEMKAHFVGALLGFDFTDSGHLRGVRDDAKQLRDRALFYLTQYLEGMTQRAPAIVMLEDIHWTDEASLEAITYLIRECLHLRLLVVCLARPEFLEVHPGWGQTDSLSTARYIQLNLEPLPQRACEELVLEILQKVEVLPEAFEAQIASTADGNPFYVEELIKMMIDDGTIVRDETSDVWRLDLARLHRLRVPPTLMAVLQARMDSLPREEKKVLQQASVVGRVFWSAVLEALQSEAQPHALELAALSRRELIFPKKGSVFVETDEYVFKHAMMRDVVYETLFKRARQAYHRQVATWLVAATQAIGRSDEYASVIAEHYDRAGEQETAVDWYLQAGERAEAQGAPREAYRLLDRALALLPASDLERRWRALLGRDKVLGTLGRTEAPIADDAALVALAQEMQDDDKLAEAYWRQGTAFGVTGDYHKELEAYEKALAAAGRAGNRRLEVLVLGMKGTGLGRLGESQAAVKCAEEALARAQALEDDGLLARTFANTAVIYTEAGDIARGTQLHRQQVAINHRLGNREGETHGLSNLGYNYVRLGVYDQGVAALERALQLANEIGHRRLSAYGQLNLALAHCRAGDAGRAQQLLERCIPELVAVNDRFGQAVGQSYYALAQEQSGDAVGARERFLRARNMLLEIGVSGYAHDALAGLARCLLSLGQLDEARQHVSTVWNYLIQHGTDGMEFPILAYQTCADVYQAQGDSESAHAAVEMGYHSLMARADRIGEPAWRQSFLEDVPEHRRVVQRWEQTHH